MGTSGILSLPIGITQQITVTFPFDLTGYRVVFTMKRGAASGSALLANIKQSSHSGTSTTITVPGSATEDEEDGTRVVSWFQVYQGSTRIYSSKATPTILEYFPECSPEPSPCPSPSIC